MSDFAQITTMMFFSALALPILFSAASSFYLNDTIPFEMEAAPLREQEMNLVKRGETDLTTMATYSIKVYVTPEVVSAFSNYTESVRYLIETVNKQYKSSEIPIKTELHCIEETQTSEADGMNEFEVFIKYKGIVKELRRSADVAALFVTNLVSPPAGGVARSSNPPNSNRMVVANNFQQSLRTRIVFGHERGHIFGARYKNGYRFSVGDQNIGTLMHTAEYDGHCCTDDYGFYSNPVICFL